MNEIYQTQDLQISEINFKDKYKDLFTEGKINDAHDVCINNNLQGKYLSSNLLNILKNNIIDTEYLYIEDTDIYLTDEKDRFQDNINNLIFLKSFDKNKQYDVNNLVLHNESIWYCIKKPPIGVINTTYWVELGLKGKKGVTTLGVNYRGKWSSFNSYNKFDMVFYQDNLYVAKNNNKNIKPDNDTYWSLELINKKAKIYVVNKSEIDKIDNGNLIFEIL